MSCIDDIQICLTRGDTFKLDVGLSDEFTEVISNPTEYVGNLVFRAEQDDRETPYLTLTVTPEVMVDPLPTDAPAYLSFAATTGQTQSLPDWDHVAYCEIAEVSGNPPEVMRLFNARIEIND